MNIGILLHGDPTRGGTINSEINFLNNMYENLSTHNFFLLSVNSSITKKISTKYSSIFIFPYKVIEIYDEASYDILKSFSCLITYPNHSNLFGGILNDNMIKMYKIISKCTNELNIPVFIRLNDSELTVRDYKKIVSLRLDNDKKTSAFYSNEENVKKSKNLVTYQTWNYNKIFWLANGSKNHYDWVVETLYDKEKEVNRVSNDRQNILDNTIYLSDDIFFSVKLNYEKNKDLDNTSYKENKLFYIGFFDTINVKRKVVFERIFKENMKNIPIKIFGKGTEILTKLKDKSNIEIEEGFIQGDNENYFKFLHNYLAYIFVGKGNFKAKYIGKTVYDCIVARIPVLIYSDCDKDKRIFDKGQYYFSNESELHDIYVKLQDENIRQDWVIDQKEQIFKKLDDFNLDLNKHCIEKTENIISTNKNISKNISKNITKPLF
jgi:hypothetical protein